MAEPLKNQLFQRPFFDLLSKKIGEKYADWDHNRFFELLYNDQWEELELKQRLNHAAITLGKSLPNNYEYALSILIKVVPFFSGFNGMLFSEFVKIHGLELPQTSLDALEVFTQFGSAEFAIRPFILSHEKMTMNRMLKWSTHENEHVRRLSSEGCRPRLPWAPALPKFKIDPAPILLILENLQDDQSLYVRKSAANNLNDISKDNPEHVLTIVDQWQKNASKNKQWIIKQALRSLVKEGEPRALLILGYKNESITLTKFTCTSKVKFGSTFKFSFELKNNGNKPAQTLVDYIIYHQKANGSLTPKVFKIGAFKLKSKETQTIKKSHNMIPISTRKYYAGLHKISIQVNGKVLNTLPFKLEID